MTEFTDPVLSPDDLRNEVASGKMRGFQLKRYLDALYKAKILVENHDGFLVHVDKSEACRTKLETEQVLDYYENAWNKGLNREHPKVAELLGVQKPPPRAAAPATRVAAAPAAPAPAPAPAAVDHTPPTAAMPTRTRTARGSTGEAAPSTVDFSDLEARITTMMREQTDRVIQAVDSRALSAEDINEALGRHSDGIHTRFDRLDLSASQVKGGIAYLAENLLNASARAEALEVMSMSLDDLVGSGFGSDPT